MARKNTLFRGKEVRSTEEIAEFLRQLADKLEENEVVLRRGSEVAKVTVPGRATFKIKVKEKQKKRKTKYTFNLKLKWSDSHQGEPVTLA
jgi:amphi-Trp domain-containing protein